MAANNFIEYHKTDLHERLLRSIALSVELLNNNKDFDVSEYDVQAIMSQFLKRNFINTNFIIYREKYGKFDCAISERGLDQPRLLYELKTYLKPKEKLNTMSAYDQIFYDLCKLKKSINEQHDCRGYFVLVCKKKDIQNVKFINELSFIDNRLNGENKKKWIEIKNKGEIFKIRPGRMIEVENTHVLRWEVK